MLVETRAPIISINRAEKTAVVRIYESDTTLPLKDWLADSIMLGDEAIIKDGEIIDYKIDTVTNKIIDEANREACLETLINGGYI